MRFDTLAVALARAGQTVKVVGAAARALLGPGAGAHEAAKVIEADAIAARERNERRKERTARERSTKEIEKSVKEKGWWFPTDRRR